MRAIGTLATSMGLAAFLVTGQALAHCGACGVGGGEDHHSEGKAKAQAHGKAAEHEGKAHAKEMGKKKGWLKANAAATGEGVSVGDMAPDFSLVDHAGNPVSLGDYAGEIVVLEWTNPGCPYVKRHYQAGTMKNLAAKWAGKGVTWLTINSTNSMGSEDNQAFAAEYDLSHKVLADPSGRVGKAYGAKTTPHMFVVDAEGKIAYVGAIDDDKQGKRKNPTNYVHQALKALTSGQAVATASTKPYGCSVKYP